MKEISYDGLVNIVQESNRVVVIAGPTAAGKDTLMRQLAAETGKKPLVSHTTRPMRPGERDGIDYYFVSEEEFKKTHLLESRTYTVQPGNQVWKYGLSFAESLKQGIIVLDYYGFEALAAKSYRLPILVYIDIDKETARSRQQRRGDYSPEEFERRWEEDKEWLIKAKNAAQYTIGGDW